MRRGKGAVSGWELEAYERDLALTETFTIATVSWDVATNRLLSQAYHGGHPVVGI